MPETTYQSVTADYFARRGLRRYAGVFSLWALGVGAVVSGHYSGRNLGLLAGGWGGYALAACIIVVMYLALVVCIAEMAAALPYTGGAYSFARASMGPWGGFVTRLWENVEYVLTPAVIKPSRDIPRGIVAGLLTLFVSRGSPWESFALAGRHRLVLSPEEAFAMKAKGSVGD